MEWCALCSFGGTTLNWRVSRFIIDNKFGRIKYIQNQNRERLSFCVITTLRHYLQKQTSLANYLHLSHFGITLYNTIVTKQTKVKFLEIAMNPRTIKETFLESIRYQNLNFQQRINMELYKKFGGRYHIQSRIIQPYQLARSVESDTSCTKYIYSLIILSAAKTADVSTQD
ncbi:Hypothetical_protein [Hexamita inflata]|uniref:Hypothetical_protein n=1 Tax=Hexamita inflata TaxID=28002 RepID=A0AA86V5F6_9EUKA|nr:Hypothetical protein HINF_LOCUS64577 [Hexamita inflata]